MHPLISALCLALFATATPAQPLSAAQGPTLSAQTVLVQAHALQQAAQAYHASQGRWPESLGALKARGSLEFLATLDEPGPSWVMPAEGKPVFVLPVAGQVELCAQVNKLGDLASEVVTKQGYTQFKMQCFGNRESTLKVVAKASVAKDSLSALPFRQVSWAGPPHDPRDPAWLRRPAQAENAAPDIACPEKPTLEPRR